MLNHLALIPDGNRRWAKKKGLPKYKGHFYGAENLKKLIYAWLDTKVKYFTIYALSYDNLMKRSYFEKKYLLKVLYDKFSELYEDEFIDKEKVKVLFIGDLNKLGENFLSLLRKIEKKTERNDKKYLTFALAYDGRRDILNAAKKCRSFTLEGFKSCLWTKNLPDVDLLIRTGGEVRISSFMLWELAYSELYFSKKLFPDFKVRDFLKAINSFNLRQRRFGK